MWIASQIAISIINALSFQRLQDSEKKYRDLVENSNSIIMRMNLNGEIVFSMNLRTGFSGIGQITFSVLTLWELFFQPMKPAPSINYLHPIIQKRFHLEITNISSSGFCVFENADESVLIKNMIINDLIINFSDTFNIHCSAKVVYCLPETQGLIQCGLAILDMAIRDYNLLNKMLIHSLDSHSHINNAVDMESLWEFFFNGNFIYPQKYHHIQSFRHELKNIYQSLYQETPSIANHFIYQKNGKIYGHISMLRAYEKCWLLQHHIAKVMDNKPVGFLLLKQMMHYFMGIAAIA